MRRITQRSAKLGLATAAFIVFAVWMSAGPAVAVDPPRTATAVITGPATVTVKQGQSTTFTYDVTGTGTIPCDYTGQAWAAVNSKFFADSGGHLEQTALGYQDFVHGDPSDGVCPTSWSGAPNPAHIQATFSASCSAPVKQYTPAIEATVSGPPMTASQLPSITFVVEAANCPPVATNDTYSTAAGTPLTVPAPGVLGNDSDPNGDPLTAVLVSSPSDASTFTLNADGSFSYQPTGGFVGTDSFTYKANDGQADSNIATVHINVTDPTPPSISDTLDPASPGDGGWYNSTPVQLDWTVTEPESPGSLVLVGCDDTTVITEQAMTDYSCSATSDGGSAGPVQVSFGVDLTAPTISPSLTNGTTFAIGQSAPSVTPHATDPDPDGNGPIVPSGVASSSCGPIDTATIGAKSVSCTATDNAGNQTTKSVSYYVTYGFAGFQSPLPKSVQKKGSTLPIKFMLVEYDGSPTFPNITGIRVQITGPVSATATCPYSITIAAYQCQLKTPKLAGNYTITAQQQFGTQWIALANGVAVTGQPNANMEPISLK